MKDNLPIFLLFLCLIFIAFLGYVNFSPASPLNKKSSSVTPTLMPQPTPTIALVTIKRGDEEEFTAGENCSELFMIFQELRSKAIAAKEKEGAEIKFDELKMEYNKITDVNQDGKVDFSDESLARKNMKDEKWCEEALNRR